MYRVRLLIALFFVLSHSEFAFASAKVDTLYSSAGDRLIISYDLVRSGDGITLHFGRARKTLGQGHGNKYRKLERLVVVFFDRTGGYEDIRFTGETPKAFQIPSGALYDYSKDGYFFFYDTDSPPDISFRMNGASDFLVNIPFFLAFNERKGHYRLISSFGELHVAEKTKKVTTRIESVTRQKTSVVELDADNGDVTKVLDCINNISHMLPEQKSLPFSESLEEDVKRLREWQYDVADPNLKKRIKQTLDDYEKTRRELMELEEKRKTQEIQRQKEEEELRARQEQEREEALKAEQQQESERANKRNTRMMIGGFILAILAFVGNQVLQSLRAKKNQLRLLEAQQNIAKRAEAEAKRWAQNEIRTQTRKTVNKAVDIVGKKKNKKNHKFSI